MAGLKGKVAVVTGAGAGIGKALATRLARSRRRCNRGYAGENTTPIEATRFACYCRFRM